MLQSTESKTRPLQHRFVMIAGATMGWFGLLGMFHGTMRFPNGAIGRKLTERTNAVATRGGASEHVTMLYGIFTTRKDVARRQLIRDTILTTLYNGRLCSLQEHKRAVLEGKGETKNCRIIYTFVVSFYEEGDHPTEHTHPSHGPVALFPSDSKENDVVYLNIKENMKAGKSPTWFKYASSLTEEYGIDYVAKADSDTFMWMPSLDEFLQRDLLPTPPASQPDNRRIFGGFMVDSNVCGGLDYPPCKKLFGKVYMAGMFYFVSSDLAHYLNHEDINRSFPVRHEDYDMGMRVLSHPYPVKLTALNNGQFWIHQTKTKSKEGWLVLWDKYKSGEKAFEAFRPAWWVPPPEDRSFS